MSWLHRATSVVCVAMCSYMQLCGVMVSHTQLSYYVSTGPHILDTYVGPTCNYCTGVHHWYVDKYVAMCSYVQPGVSMCSRHIRSQHVYTWLQMPTNGSIWLHKTTCDHIGLHIVHKLASITMAVQGYSTGMCKYVQLCVAMWSQAQACIGVIVCPYIATRSQTWMYMDTRGYI